MERESNEHSLSHSLGAWCADAEQRCRTANAALSPRLLDAGEGSAAHSSLSAVSFSLPPRSLAVRLVAHESALALSLRARVGGSEACVSERSSTVHVPLRSPVVRMSVRALGHNGYDRYCHIVLVLIALVVTPRVHLRAW